MDNIDTLNELRHRKSVITDGGGAKIQHDAGKLTARERIGLLMDEGSFIEIDAFVGPRVQNAADVPGDGVVCGYGTVDGRLTYVYAQDYTVLGGAIGEMHAGKICKIIGMAIKMGAPVIGIIDSDGSRLKEGVDALGGFGDILCKSVAASGVIPQITAVMGPCAGIAAQAAALTDFVIMTEKNSKMFTAGPLVVEAVTGTSGVDISSAKAHSEVSGSVNYTAADDRECVELIKILLSYIPDNNLSDAPVLGCSDDLNRLSGKLMTITENDYDVREIITEVVDDGAFFESGAGFAGNMVTGFARMNGYSVGIVANQPGVLGGAIDIDGADKAARFIRFCDSFNIPIISFTDTEGYAVGAEQETGGIIRHAAKLIYAFAEAVVPKVNIIVGKAYGGAYTAMNSRHLGCDMVLAWPGAEISAVSPEAAANILLRDEIMNAADPIKARKEKIEEYRRVYANPYVAAQRGYIDDVIEPDSTRPRVIAALEMLKSKRDERMPRKHGNMPL